MKDWLEYAKKHNTQTNADILTLALGLGEEAGEVEKAINVFHNPLYIPRKDRSKYESVEHELIDLVMYISHIANKLGIQLNPPEVYSDNEWSKERIEKLRKTYSERFEAYQVAGLTINDMLDEIARLHGFESTPQKGR